MYRATPPSRHAILSSLLVAGTIIFLGSFHDPGEAVAFATIFVGFPWFAYYFLEWLAATPPLPGPFEFTDRER